MSSTRSPCIKKCEMVEGSCTGCLRTSEEISNWGLMEDNERIALIKELKNRRKNKRKNLYHEIK